VGVAVSEGGGVLSVSGLVKAYTGAEDGARAVDGVDFEIPEGKFFTLLGPSGCGKSTTLRCVAGLETIDDGQIRLDGRLVSSVKPKVFVPPDDRALGMVFQSYAIWPHMTVFENVAFPLRAAKRRLRGRSRAAVRAKVMDTLERVQLEKYEARMATKLSGGQQQRLALARALVNDPKVLLLDEPLSNLDAALREEMRTELRMLQREAGVTTLYVTHDQTEALSMSNIVAVMNAGKIVQAGSPRELYRRPASEFVATFVGQTNLLQGEVVGRGDPGTFKIETPYGAFVAVCAEGVVLTEKVAVSIRPEDIRIHTERPPAGTPNVIEARVERRMYFGESIEYELRVGRELLMGKQHPDVLVRRRQDVFLEFPVDHCVVLSKDHGTTERTVADDDDDTTEDDGPQDEAQVMTGLLSGIVPQSAPDRER
jgi:iron(III) transport system ATP-binding protein